MMKNWEKYVKSIFKESVKEKRAQEVVKDAAALLLSKVNSDLNAELIDDYETAIDIYEIFEDDAVARQLAIDTLKEAIRLIKEEN